MKVRIVTVLILLLMDFLLLPSLMTLPEHIISYGLSGAEIWLNEINLIASIQLVIEDQQFRTIWLMLQLLVLAAVIGLLWRTNPKLDFGAKNPVGGPKAAGAGQFGTSRWQTIQEINQTFTPWRVDKPLMKGGIVAGYNVPKKTAYLVTDDTHSIELGATRSGKSRRLILPSIWELAKAGESMILTDPKGELFDYTHDYLERTGYNIVCLDFRKPGRGNRWNPMWPIIEALRKRDESEASKAAFNMAHLFVHQNPDSMRGDQVWNNGAESTIAALTLAIATEASSNREKHMTSVYKTLMELGEPRTVQVGNAMKEYVPLNEYMKSLPIDHIARDAFSAARLAPDRMRGSFYSQVSTLLRLFADPSIAYLTAEQDHDISKIGTEKTAVFLIIPDEDTTRHSLASLYVDQSYQILVDVANQHSGRLPVRVNYLLDEFGNMPPIKDFATKLTVSGGRGIRYHLVLQDFQQLKSKYKDDAQTIKGNCYTWIYLLTQDVETAKEISAACGKYTIQTHNRSATYRSKEDSSGLSVGLTGRDLLTPDEVKRWPEDVALVIRARNFPAKLPLPDLSLWPAAHDFIKRGGDEERKVSRVSIFVPHESSNADHVRTSNRSYMDEVF